MIKQILLLVYCSLVASQTITVVSRNQKLNEMAEKTKTSIIMIENLITEGEKKMNEDYENCQQNAENQNCSSLEVWKHERTKHSKNITNLEKKIDNYQDTIEKIMETNEKETKKKQQTIKAMLPKIQNLKDTIEYLQNIEWLITDSYVNIENSQKSLMNLFDIKENSKSPSVLAELIHKNKDFHDPGARPSQQEQLPEHPEKPISSKKKFNQGPPLIDEDIFDGSNEEIGEGFEQKLFEDCKPEKVLKAEKINQGLDIPEHDDNAKEIDEIVKKYASKQEKEDDQEDNQNLNLDQSSQEFKIQVKKIGSKLLERLSIFRQKVQQEEDNLVQGVADLEKAIYNLNHKHASQIVQIYLEAKTLQRNIFEKDDLVLVLDAKIHDCKNFNKILKECQQNKDLNQEYISTLEAQKAINQGIIEDLNKLLKFDDKNVELTEVQIDLPIVILASKERKQKNLVQFPQRRQQHKLQHFPFRRRQHKLIQHFPFRRRQHKLKSNLVQLKSFPFRRRQHKLLQRFPFRRRQRKLLQHFPFRRRQHKLQSNLVQLQSFPFRRRQRKLIQHFPFRRRQHKLIQHFPFRRRQRKLIQHFPFRRRQHKLKSNLVQLQSFPFRRRQRKLLQHFPTRRRQHKLKSNLVQLQSFPFRRRQRKLLQHFPTRRRQHKLLNQSNLSLLELLKNK